jgi:hypothetical protein
MWSSPTSHGCGKVVMELSGADEAAFFRITEYDGSAQEE